MTLIGCVPFVIIPACVDNYVCFLFALNAFTFFLGQSFLTFMSKIRKHIKSRKSKKFDRHYWYCHKHVLPCTSVLMALCICEHSLFFMHSYHCGRNLDIYVTVVNRSSNLSWTISQWYCWYWDMYRLVPIYLSIYLFYCFCLKNSSNVNLQMKRDIEL